MKSCHHSCNSCISKEFFHSSFYYFSLFFSKPIGQVATKQFLVLFSNSELGSFLPCKATEIFYDLSVFLFGLSKKPKTKTALKQLKKREGSTGPAVRAGPASV
jgi:hypothetical protein